MCTWCWRVYRCSSECSAWRQVRHLLRKCIFHKRAYLHTRIQYPCHQTDGFPFGQEPRSSSRRWRQRGWGRRRATWRRARLRSRFHQCLSCKALGFSWSILVILSLVESFACRCLSCAGNQTRSRRGLAGKSWWCCTFGRSVAHRGAVRQRLHRIRSRIMEPHTKSSCRSCTGQAMSYVCKPHDRGRTRVVSRI